MILSVPRLLLALLLAAFPAAAVVPWTLNINTNNVRVVTNATYGAMGNGIATKDRATGGTHMCPSNKS